MDILSMNIIWCDGSFENDNSYQSMKNECNETATGIPQKEVNPIDMAIFNEGKEELRSNNVPLITVRTADDAMRQIEENKDKKIFLICSGILGQYLVPEIAIRYPYVHNVYIYAHNLVLNANWADKYIKMLKMFNFHATLLLRLTRDIAYYFIGRGKMFLEVNAPRDALICFNHARNLEIGANIREKIPANPNSNEPDYQQPDFRDHLDLLEGENGLISQAEKALRAQEDPFETS